MDLSCRNISFPFRRIPRWIFGLPNLKEPTFEMLKCHKQMPSFHRPLINQTSLHPKWKEPLPQISSGCQCLAIKRTRRSGALWKPLGSELSGIKTPTAACVSGSHLPSPLCTRLCCEACPGVVFRLDGGQKVFRHASCWCFLIPCIFIFRAVCPSYHQDAMEPFSGESASRAEFPPKILPDK